MIIGEISMTNKEKKTLIGNKIFVETEIDGQLVLCALTRFEYLQMKLLALKTGEYIKKVPTKIVNYLPEPEEIFEN